MYPRANEDPSTYPREIQRTNEASGRYPRGNQDSSRYQRENKGETQDQNQSKLKVLNKVSQRSDTTTRENTDPSQNDIEVSNEDSRRRGPREYSRSDDLSENSRGSDKPIQS